MPAMSLPNSKRTGKRISFFNDQGVAMKETSSQQNPEGSCYGLGAPASDPGPGQSKAAGTVTSTTSNPEAPHTGMYLNSVIFSPEKGDQSRGHYQQTVPMKWAHQDPEAQPQPQQRTGTETANWTQGVTMANWGQNFAPYLGGVNVSDSRSQTQTAFSKQQIREGPPPLQPQQPQSPSRAAEKQPPQPQQVVNPLPAGGEAYRDVRDVAKPPSLEWEQQHQASQQQQQSQTQAFPQTLKPGALNAQQHSTSNPGSSSVLQPFQLAFGQPKQHLTAGYYQVFQGGNRTLPNLNYNAQQPKPQPHPQTQQHPQLQQKLQQTQQHPQLQQQLQQTQQHPQLQQQLQQTQQHPQLQQQLQQTQQHPQLQQQLQQTQQHPQLQQQLQQTQQHPQLQQQLQRQQQQKQILQHQQQMQQQHHKMQQQQMLQHQQQLQQQQQLHIQQEQQLEQQQQIQHQQQIQQQLQQQQQQIQQQQLQQQQPEHVLEYYPSSQNPPTHQHPHSQPPVLVPSQEPFAKTASSPDLQEMSPDPPNIPPQTDSQLPPTETQLQPPHIQLQPRRSRRLSKEGGPPPVDNPFLIPSDGAQNGASEEPGGAPKADEVHVAQMAPTGVIQSTRRKRRVSQEVNLETLAQKASEMESLPPHIVKAQHHRPWSPQRPAPGRGTMDKDSGGHSAKRPRDESMMPLVIPVSVPVRRPDPSSSSPDGEHSTPGTGWPQRPFTLQDVTSMDGKPSVIVTRRRSLRNSLSESSGQNGGMEGGNDNDGKKPKRRPRPEPLFIPPPKPGTFIAPPVYSCTTPYQSHLRSPVRLIDNPLTMPPYTPPPILSPVREGSGLYFSTFLSSAASSQGLPPARVCLQPGSASTQGLPPPITPKSATRSLLRSNSVDITPPLLSTIGEATPVSIEPRINIGVRYQAEVPELRQRSAAQQDHPKAELVWAPLHDLEAKPEDQERVDDLMNLACSSALHGGGTNQELALHCLYECKGDIMEALALLLLKKPIFPKNHRLGYYHYSGSDSWTPVERSCFNKGIAAYKKDFFMVQKLVSTKTVAQCVEFYYSYKRQVKTGRNGALIYGDMDPPESRNTEEELDHKSSQSCQRLESRKEEEDNRNWEGSVDRKHRGSSPSRVTQTLQATENAGAVLVLKTQEDVRRDQMSSRVSQPPQPSPSAPSKPRPPPKTGTISGTKGPAGPEGEFPCKKCGRIFYKVKSRSAHMKSHAEQEKKAAALRQKEAEERAAAQAAAEAVALLAARQDGEREGNTAGGDSTNDDSSEEDDDEEEDEDWH
uniref:mitotic deacetylase-associated SANT domain protein-like n=1 Tax=Oncorhynchus gorbuscha TaxID=8017 RepID=UPI001EAE9625|nr:mitotic deacetylase-associated SANT domain protein-like [Oncorhynchus gorbuscha]XP_046223269.1 mitotic deacetylase-associated SANT domain protein-like [Oncorhynchus gorbuscha]